MLSSKFLFAILLITLSHSLKEKKMELFKLHDKLTEFEAMKFLIASIYANFMTEIHEHGDMNLLDSYLARPKGRRLTVLFYAYLLNYDHFLLSS